MVLPYKIIPIIEIPGYGNVSAQKICLENQITNSGEKNKLSEAKDFVYKKGFYDGIITVGEFKGQKVYEVK